MAVELAVAYVSIVPSAKGMASALDKELGGPLQKAAKESGEKAGKSWADSFSKNADKMTDFGKKGLAATAILGVGLFATAKAAGNLEAAISANIQVLGEASGEVRKFAENSVENVGLSERAALEAATSFGQLGKIIGLGGTELAGFSTELVTAAADMAAFKDVPVAQALDDLQSGFAGSTEVLRKYGIFLDEGSLKQAYFRETGETVTGTLTAQQRIVATNSELWRQGADMWGQAEREAGGLARAQDNLKANAENASAALGEQLVPAMTMVLGGATALIQGFAGANEATGGFLVTALAVGTGLLGVASSVSFVGGKIGGLVDKLSKVDGAGKRTLTTTGKISGALGALGAVIGVATLAYDGYNQNKREAEQRTKDLAAALDLEGQAQSDAIAALAGGDVVFEKYVGSIELLGLGLSDVNQFVDEGTGKVAGLSEMWSKYEDVDPAFAVQKLRQELELGADVTDHQVLLIGEFIDQTRAVKKEQEDQANTQARVNALHKISADELDRVSTITDKAANASIFLSDALDDQAGYVTTVDRSEQDFQRSLRDAATAQREQEKAAEDGEVALDGLSKALAEQTTAYDVLASAADNLNTAIDKVFGGTFSLEEANRAYTAGVLELNEAWKTAGKEGDELKEVQASLKAGFDINTSAGIKNREMVQGQVQAILDLAVASTEAGESQQAVTDKVNIMTQGLKDQLAAAGFTTEQIDTYIASLGLTPENVTTTIELANDQAAKAEIEAIIGDLGVVDVGAVAEITALVEAGELDTALTKARDLAGYDGKTVNMAVWASINSRNGGRMAIEGTATGGFFRGGTNQIRSVAEIPGSRGDEVVFPLGDQARMAELAAHPLVFDRLSAAMPGYGTVDFGALASLDMTSSSGQTAIPPISVHNNGRDFTVADMSHAIALARLAA